jgi:hypothetical protein
MIPDIEETAPFLIFVAVRAIAPVAGIPPKHDCDQAYYRCNHTIYIDRFDIADNLSDIGNKFFMLFDSG